MNSNKYWTEINKIAKTLAEESLADNYNDVDAARDDIFDSRLHETIDGHQWVIYDAYNLDVIRNSDNSGYYEQNFGADDVAATLKDGGIDKLHTVMAYFAMYGDVSDKIEDALETATEALETA